MKLSNEGLRCPEWKEKGYKLFDYDRAGIEKATHDAPVWVHFGAGNIFRGFPARLDQILIEKGLTDKGIIVGEGFDYDIISDIYDKYDRLTLLVTLKANGSIDKEIVGSVTEAYPCDYQFADAWKRFGEIFTSPSLQMVSFTITEKGYALKDPSGEYLKGYVHDFREGPGKCVMFLSRLAELLLMRYKSGAYPIALVSMDNCSHNGEKVQTAITTIVGEWCKAGLVDKGFEEYVNSDKVSYPWSMIDKITPRPDKSVASMLAADGYEDTETVITDKHTYIASFVNAEECEYLVIEDTFPNGRPALENAGVYFTDRDTVNKVEKMKVCTCLNPLHTALAVFGCLLGYTLIADEMKDADLVKLVKRIGYKEGLPVVVNPGIIDPEKFIDEVVDIRIPNPFMPDTPQRIATDTSQKLSIRFGETIKAYLASDKLSIDDLVCIPLVFAAWLRYAMGVDDEGKVFEPSSDPLLAYAKDALKGIGLGYIGSLDQLREILSNQKIFGVDLYEAGLADKVLGYFASMIKGPGAVRETLHKVVG